MAVTGISTTARKILKDLDIELLIVRLDEFLVQVERQRDNLTTHTTDFRRAKDIADDRKAELLVQVSRDNEGKPESFIERQHKMSLAEDETYSSWTVKARIARDNIEKTEGLVKVYEGEIRSLQAQLNVMAGALQASASQTRAKTTASIIGQQANILLGANL